MAKHGTLGEYNADQEEWSVYTERLEHYFTANDVKDASKRRAILLSVCGARTYSLIRSLVAPDKVTDFNFEQLVEKVKAHQSPRPSVIAQRFKFNSRARQGGESIASFVAELRKLAEHCEFGDMLEDMLRDRLVSGIEDIEIQHRLLSESKLTLKRALEIASAMELAAKDAKVIRGTTNEPQVNKVTGSQPRPYATAYKQGGNKKAACYRCGNSHPFAECRYKNAVCRECGKIGHIDRVCRSKQKSVRSSEKGEPQAARTSKENSRKKKSETEQDCLTVSKEYSVYPVGNESVGTLKTTVKINGKELSMDIDTGAAVSLISETVYKRLLQTGGTIAMEPSNTKLRTYTGEHIVVLGKATVTVKYKEQTKQLPLHIVGGNGPSLMGRDWLAELTLNWKDIFSLGEQQTIQSVLDQHKALFKEELGKICGVQAKLYVDLQVKPQFWKARQVPHVLKKKVELELERLLEDGVITPVQFSEWAAPIAPIVKPDGKVRICGDYKLTVNKVSKTEIYPLPLVEDLLAKLAGGVVFTKLDLSHAYQQLELSEESRPYVTINTHKGLYTYNRLPFGVASAPAIFQRIMEELLQGLPHVCVYIDDILITGKSQQEHLHNLDQVLQILESAGMRLRKDKCMFAMPEVEYLGYKITKEGLKPSENKVKAITKAPEPKNLPELRSFLGLVNYYAKFLPDLSTVLAPMHILLRKGVPWKWGTEQRAAYDRVKDMLKSPKLLAHFDQTLPLVLSCDASPYGVGAVLSHILEDGEERPIAFASRSLATAERQYSQLDREALAIIFGVKRFHSFLYGHQFVIQSDHKPLQYILSENKAVSPMASARLQRWAVILGGYQYSIKYKPGNKQGNVDALSRLPLAEPSNTDIPVPVEVVALLEHLDSTPVSAKQIKTQTDRDPLMSRVKKFVMEGWPQGEDSKEIAPFSRRKDELSLQEGCILWGTRVIVPVKLRNKVLIELHDSHPGISRMKNLARQYVWWPGMDKDIEKEVQTCSTCQASRNMPQSAPLHVWEWPQRPWTRVHADYAGPLEGKMFLILIDAHSKWMEVYPTSSSTSSTTIEKLRQSFCYLGLPEILVTDNGSTFTSDEFEEFMKRNGVRHIKTSPYHPASNGLAERAVQTFKAGLRKLKEGTLETRVSRFLFSYRVTPQSVIETSPAELMFGRRLRSHLELMQPVMGAKVHHHQEKQKSSHDLHAKARVLECGDKVFIKDTSSSKEWDSGVVIEVNGPVTYKVKLQDGRILRRHIDHIRKRQSPDPEQEEPESEPELNTNASTTIPQAQAQQEVGSHSNLRRSSRTSHPPNRL